MHFLYFTTFINARATNCRATNLSSLMGGYRGGNRVSGPPPEKSQKLGFVSNTGQDPLKNHKATKPAFNVGPLSARQRNTIYIVFRHLNDISLSGR